MADLRTSLRQRARVAAAAGVGLACAAATAAGAAAAGPVSGSVSGPVVSVKGSAFTLTTKLSPTGKSKVSVSKSTVITTQETLSRSALTKGACVAATGQRNSKGVVVATRITLTVAVKGTCSAFQRGGGTRPPGSGTRPPGTGTPPPGTGQPGGGFGGANFGFAFGKISALKGSTLTVKGTFGSKAVTTKVDVSAKTQIEKTVQVGASAIAVKSCVFVNGTSGDKGLTVKAQTIAVSKRTSTGCQFGRQGP